MSDDSNPSNPESPSSSLSGTTTELFRLWCHSCWQKPNDKENTLLATAASFFASLTETTSVQIGDGTTLQTKGSHEQALAVLIQSMSVIWGGSTNNSSSTGAAPSDVSRESMVKEVSGLVARQNALLCLTGALEGCGKISLSNHLVQSLGDFLVNVAGPVQMDDDDDDPDSDVDEKLRDTALKALQVLLRSPLSSSSEDENAISASAGLLQRLALAQAAVQRRCAVPEFDEEGEDPPPMGRVRSGLATLPRSRRSICFSTLQAPLECLAVGQSALASITSQQQQQQQHRPQHMDQLSNFVKFAASCLHGESDPRCLLQILQLLHIVQLRLGPLFTDAPFPASEVFDAAAPYYPIQFTPPPNDVHGITREGLSNALWKVLSYTENDRVLMKHGHDTMMSLSLGLFLDTLNPPPEDGPPTAKDQQEALESLYGILLDLELDSSEPDDTTIGKTDRITLLEPITLKQIIDAVWTLHGEMSRKLTTDAIYRKLAHYCRTFVSHLALAVEQAANAKGKTTTALFDTLVTQRLRSFSDQNPNDLAYLACLASSGGVRCLQMSLEIGLGPKIASLSNDTAKASDTCDTLAAVVAACKAGCDRMKQRGLTISPHPLESHAPRLFSALHEILLHNPSTGAVRAVVSLFSATPSHIWKPDLLLGPVDDIIKILLKPLVGGSTDTDKEADDKWIECCVQAVSQIFALAQEEESQSILNQDPIRALMIEKFGELVDSCGADLSIEKRFDRKCLALTCSQCEAMAKASVASMLKKMVESLSGEGPSIVASIYCLSTLIREGGMAVSRELQQTTATPTLIDFINTLTKSNENETSAMESIFGISTLELPPTDEESSGLETKVIGMYDLLLPIIPDYSKVIMVGHRKQLLSVLEKLLPPLNQNDVVKLSVVLPFVSKAMQHSDGIDLEEQALWMSVKSYLVEFALGDEPFVARRFAAEALHGLIVHASEQEESCPVLSLMTENVLPALISLTKDIADRDRLKKKCKREINRLIEMIAFVGLLGSAATSRGSSSASTSSCISDFLIDLSTGATATFKNEKSKTIVLPSKHGPGQLSLSAADAFGSMILGTMLNSISGQRLKFFAMKRFRETATTIKSLSPGMVLVSSHLVCAVDLGGQSDETVKLLLEIILGGLKMVGADGFEFPSSAKKVALAALVKTQMLRPDVVEPFVYPLVTGVLRSYATATKSDSPEEVIEFKILALQVLESAATAPVSKDAFVRLKQAVIAIISATLNEKSSILRHAAVDVLNAWHAI